MHSLSLHAIPGLWRMQTIRKADPAFRTFQQKVFARDYYACQFCGFQAKEFQEVVNVDLDYTNNKLSNLVTSCCFCAQCFFLDSAGVGNYGGGTVIYLPEFSQVELNSFCHVIFCAIVNDTGYKSSAQSIYRSLKSRGQKVEDKFGEGSSDPAILGRLLIETNVDTAKQGPVIFKNLRLLPSHRKFRKQIEYWAARALDELSSDFK